VASQRSLASSEIAFARVVMALVSAQALKVCLVTHARAKASRKMLSLEKRRVVTLARASARWFKMNAWRATESA